MKSHIIFISANNPLLDVKKNNKPQKKLLINSFVYFSINFKKYLAIVKKNADFSMIKIVINITKTLTRYKIMTHLTGAYFKND